MVASELERHKYDTVQVSRMLTNGQGGAAKTTRSWFRQGRIEGARQRQKNAKVWFNTYGVLQAWELWADHNGLDPVSDLPDEIRKLKNQVDAAAGNSSIGLEMKQAANGRLTVTVFVPRGVSLKVVQQD